MRDPGHDPIETLEPFLDAIHEGVSRAGWIPVSQELGGREYLSGAGTRSPVKVARTALLRFHRSDLPCEVMLEIQAEQAEQGLRGTLSLVLAGPRYADLGPAATVLDRVTAAIRETFRRDEAISVSLDLGLASAQISGPDARIRLRVSSALPPCRMAEGPVSIRCLLLSDVGAMERLLECPEIAEFLPPVVE
jgi:hypothetical protein